MAGALAECAPHSLLHQSCALDLGRSSPEQKRTPARHRRDGDGEKQGTGRFGGDSGRKSRDKPDYHVLIWGGRTGDVRPPTLGRQSWQNRSWPGKPVGSRARRPCGDAAASSGRSWAGGGIHPAMLRAHARAFVLSVIPGNRRRNSIAADSSPSLLKVARIAAASASVMTNIPKACRCTPRLASAGRVPGRQLHRKEATDAPHQRIHPAETALSARSGF